MDFKLLKQLYKIHSKSGYEGKIISFVCKWVDKNIQDVKIELDWWWLILTKCKNIILQTSR